MAKDNATSTITDSPEITKTRTKSFSNPIKTFRERRASKASAAAAMKAAREIDATDAEPLVLRTDQSPVSATNPYEQDTFISMMRATRGMSPEEVKLFLQRKAQADHEKHKNDVSGLSDGGNMIWMPEE
jgi:hypothetical protein